MKVGWMTQCQGSSHQHHTSLKVLSRSWVHRTPVFELCICRRTGGPYVCSSRLPERREPAGALGILSRRLSLLVLNSVWAPSNILRKQLSRSLSYRDTRISPLFASQTSHSHGPLEGSSHLPTISQIKSCLPEASAWVILTLQSDFLIIPLFGFPKPMSLKAPCLPTLGNQSIRD
jgi:hypothetical protein